MTHPWESLDALKRDCRWFRGDIPCKPHKLHGVHCVDPLGAPCPHYETQTFDILIIKLGAIGDVIRTTPLLRRIKTLQPFARVWWLTHTPEILPESVDVPLQYTPQSLAILASTRFHTIFNLDKDREACALTALLTADHKKGFTLRDGKPFPIDADAHAKYLTGVFDDLSKENCSSYLSEIFTICGYQFAGEEYILDAHEGDGYVWKLPKKKPIVGLNTGCGGRWTSRLWPEKNWILLAKKLRAAGYTPLLLGGEQEHTKNKRIAARSGALYFGHFPLRQFINLMQQCDLVVTAVTMAMHIAIGLRKNLVLFNNIFNRHEFELYGRGVILEPEVACTCYYSPVCPNNCMQYIRVPTVFDSCKRLLTS